jgi:hypothetical protein
MGGRFGVRFSSVGITRLDPFKAYRARGISIFCSFVLAGYFSESFFRSPKSVSDFMIISPAVFPPTGSEKMLSII